jgi:hypothetical protein
MTPPRFVDPSAGRQSAPIPPGVAARLRRELGEPLYALLAEAELLRGMTQGAGSAGERAASERIVRLARELTAALRDLR